MGLETAASVATIAGGATAVGSGIATIFGGSGDGGGSRPLQLPPELEANQLDVYRSFLNQAEQNIAEGRALIPQLEQRLTYMNQIAQAATPDPSVIQSLTDLDNQIAARFGRETAADVQAGIITDEAKAQTIQLQNQIRAELEAQGRTVDGQTAAEINQLVRNRLSGTSRENLALDEVGRALVDEVRRSGDIIPDRDPRVESQIRDQEDAMRARLRAQFGPDYENTTQGRRALRDFYQGATETRFAVTQQLKQAAGAEAAGRVQRLSQLAATATGLVEARDTGVLRNVEAAKGASDLLSGRIQRLSGLNQAIQGTVATALQAGEPERQRQLLDVQRAGVAQASAQNIRGQFNAGLTSQQNILQLSQIPFQLRQQLLQQRASTLEAGERLGQFEFSPFTKEALQFGDVRGFQGRGQLYGGRAAEAERRRIQLADLNYQQQVRDIQNRGSYRGR